MTEEQNTKFLMDLIDFIDNREVQIDGVFKSAMLKTAASYYEHMTQAEAMTVALSRAFQQLQ